MKTYTFTVFTSAYNAAHTLHRVYDSLLKQTFRDFEWLIIDDGSTDQTLNVAEKMRDEGKIQIRLMRQKNMHKFFSLLYGIKLADSTFFLIADADDEFREDTLELLHETYLQIPLKDKTFTLGVNCLCKDVSGNIIGDMYPRDGMMSDHSEMLYRYKVKGEKWGMQLTSVLQQFKFPDDFFNNGYIPEGILWRRIANAGYKIKFINQALRTYHNESERISISTLGRSSLKRNSFGCMKSHEEELNNEMKYFWYRPVHFIKATVLYYESSRWQEMSAVEAARKLHVWPRVLFWILFPLSVMVIWRRSDSKFDHQFTIC